MPDIFVKALDYGSSGPGLSARHLTLTDNLGELWLQTLPYSKFNIFVFTFQWTRATEKLYS